MKKNNPTDSLREIVFGLEDGMVSTMGVITGIASGTENRFIVLLAGFVVISVESLSMAAGTYLSNKTEEELYANKTKIPLHAKLHRQSIDGVKADSIYMGIAYVFGGLIPLLPYFFTPLNQGIILSVVFTLIGLLGIGAWRSKITNMPIIKGALEMAIISLSAAGIGYLIGEIVKNIYPELRNSI